MNAVTSYYLIEGMAMILPSFTLDNYSEKTAAQCQAIVDQQTDNQHLNSSICQYCTTFCMSVVLDLKSELGCCMNFYSSFLYFLNKCQITLICRSGTNVIYGTVSVILQIIITFVL